MKPVVLLVPGMLNDARVWDDVAAGLHDEAEVRVADVCTQADIAGMARDALALLSDVDPARSVVPVGFSMGGYVTIALLAARPSRWHAAVLLATSCLPETPEGAAGRDAAVAAFRADFEGTCRGVARRGLASKDPALHERLLAMMRDVGMATAIRQTLAIRARADHRAALGALALPVWVACGELDRIVPPAMSEALAAAIPGARLERIADAGHMLPIERPQAVVDLVRQALAHGP
ncbi:MAG: alpha/beta fold hydrolase [Burkholderiales bacterium]